MFSMPGRIDIDELVDAANDGNEMKVCELLGASANPNRPHYWTSWSPLACAAKKGHSFILQQLLDHSADPSWMVRVSPLAEAAGAGQLDCVRRLLNANAPVDWPGEDGFPPLYSACANAHIPCVKLLLSAKADADVRTQGLSYSSSPGSKPEQDKKPGKGEFSFTSLCISSEKDQPELVKLLLKAKASVDLPISGEGSAVERASEDGRPCRAGLTPLMLTALSSNCECMRLLIDAQASLNATNCQGYTALHVASGWGAGYDTQSELEDAIRLLVNAGSSKTARDLLGRTARDVAASQHHIHVVSMLQGAGASPDNTTFAIFPDGVLRGALESGLLLPTMSAVLFSGLKSRADLNGTSGTLLAWKPTGEAWVRAEDGIKERGPGRWAVHCESDGESCLFKADNLVLLETARDEAEEEECPVCCETLPRHGDASTDHGLLPCCGKLLCGSCFRNLERHAAGEKQLCVLCRQPYPETDAEVLPLLEKRAAAGHPHSKMLLAYRYAAGEVVKRDQALALQLLTEAGEAGFIAANVQLGGMLMGVVSEGMSIEPDPERGYRLLFDASVQGSPFAWSTMARVAIEDDNAHCFQTMCGEVLECDLDHAAMVLWHRAAELGDEGARLNLKRMMKNGSVSKAERVPDRVLLKAVASADVEEICKALETHSVDASAEMVAEARLARDRLKKKARKKAAKPAKVGCVECAPQNPSTTPID